MQDYDDGIEENPIEEAKEELVGMLTDEVYADRTSGPIQRHLEDLRTQLDVLAADNDVYMQEHGLGMSPLAVPQTQIRVLVEMMYPEQEERVAFDILVQRTIRQDMEDAVAEIEAQKARQRLTAGITGAGVGIGANGPMPAGAVDLSAFRDAPRKVRREVARKAVKDAMRGGND